MGNEHSEHTSTVKCRLHTLLCDDRDLVCVCERATHQFVETTDLSLCGQFSQ